jgi:TolB protein
MINLKNYLSLIERTGIIISITLFVFIFITCKEASIEPIFYGSLQGKVVDAETNEPLYGASISTNPASSSVTTDYEGKYKIESIPVGNYTIICKKFGYEKEQISVSVLEEYETVAMLFLHKSEVVINPPSMPQNSEPVNGSTQNEVKIILKWTAGVNNQNDSVYFDVFLYEALSTDCRKIGTSLRDTTLEVTDLKYNHVYFWYVEAFDNYSNKTRSEIWNFKTKVPPLNPILFSLMIDNQYDIYSIDENGNDKVEVIALSGNELWPRYNNEKRFIAYCSNYGWSAEIFIKDLKTDLTTKVTNLPVSGYHNNGFGFCWTNDGGGLVYPYYDKLYKVDINGFNRKMLIQAPADRNFRESDYSPIEDKIVVLTVGINQYDSEIYLYDQSVDTLKLLVDNLPGIIERPSFTIDGKNILFTRDISGYESLDGRQLNSHIFIMNLTSMEIKDISVNKIDGTNDLNPRISSDGAYIIFNNAVNNNNKQPDLVIMDLMGRQRRVITSGGIMADWK